MSRTAHSCFPAAVLVLGLALAAGAAGPAPAKAKRPARATFQPPPKVRPEVQRLLQRAENERGDRELRLIEEAAWIALHHRDSAGLELTLNASIDEFRWLRRQGSFHSALSRLLRMHRERGRLTAFGASVEVKLADLEVREGVRDAARERYRRVLTDTGMPGFVAPRSLDRTLIAAGCFGGLVATDPSHTGKPINPYYRQAANILLKRFPWTLETGRLQMRAGWNAAAAGEHEHSLEYFERALRVFQRVAPTSLWEADAYGNRAAELVSLGRIKATKALGDEVWGRYIAALPLWGKRAWNMHKEGIDAFYRGDLRLALDRFQKAIRAIEQHCGGPDINRWSGSFMIHFGESYSHTGWALQRLRGEQASDHYLERAIAWSEAFGGSWATISIMNNAASTNLELGRVPEAERQIRRTIRFEPALRAAIQGGGFEGMRAAENLLRHYRNEGILEYIRGNLEMARTRLEAGLSLEPQAAKWGRGNGIFTQHERDLRRVRSYLARIYDELGLRENAKSLLRELIGLAGADAAATNAARSHLAQLLLEDGCLDEAKTMIALTVRSDSGLFQSDQSSGAVPYLRPAVRVISPKEIEVIPTDNVEVRLLFLAPIPLARYRVSINGRPLGPAAGFDLPLVNAKGQVLDKGRVLDRGEVLDKGRVLDRGLVLDKGEDREKLASELPAESGALVRNPKYSQFLQIRHRVPLEDTDGEFVRIAFQVEAIGGSVSDRQILRLRRPQAEQRRGALRVLAVGIGAYERLPKLGYASEDALALGDAFRGQAGEHRLYRGADITMVTDAQATIGRLREALDQFTRNVRPGDTLILALSGHGIRAGPPKTDLSSLTIDAMMAREPVQPKFYFAPVRFDPENPAGTGLPWSEVLAKLEIARKTAKAIWVLADCCRAAPGLRRELVATARDLKRGIDEGGNLILCAASEGDSPSYESEDLKHGIFTQAWLEALSGKGPEIVYEDRPLGRVLTLSGLQFAVDYAVRQHARKAGVRQQVEFPRLEGSFSPGQPVFVPVGQGG